MSANRRLIRMSILFMANFFSPLCNKPITNTFVSNLLVNNIEVDPLFLPDGLKTLVMDKFSHLVSRKPHIAKITL